MQQRRGACTSGREQEEEEERWKKGVKERERIKRSVQKSRCKCHFGKRSKRRGSRAPQNIECSFHTLTSDADLEH